MVARCTAVVGKRRRAARIVALVVLVGCAKADFAADPRPMDPNTGAEAAAQVAAPAAAAPASTGAAMPIVTEDSRFAEHEAVGEDDTGALRERKKGARRGYRKDALRDTKNLPPPPAGPKAKATFAQRMPAPDQPADRTAEINDMPEPAAAPAEQQAAAKPQTFLPRTCYFRNTYLGGNAVHRERLRRLDEHFSDSQRPYRLTDDEPALQDPPERAAIALSARLSRRSLAKPGPVYLHINLRGSDRYGWRRPPLDVMVVVERMALARSKDDVDDALRHLASTLGPQDRLAVILAGARLATDSVWRTLAEPDSMRHTRSNIARALAEPTPRPHRLTNAIANAMQQAGARLDALAANTRRVPGTKVVLVLARTRNATRIQAAANAAHRLTVAGTVTSVLSLRGQKSGDWWQVANAGHGQFHRVEPGQSKAAIDDELSALGRVVARLLRVNIRLGKHTHAVRILGSEVLQAAEIKQVKQREKAVDQALNASLGVVSDRGADDDGIQSVMPYFLGGDSHSIIVELWVDKPGPVADITLKYKDLVQLGNQTARTSVALDSRPRTDSTAERNILATVHATEVAVSLRAAAAVARTGELHQARLLLQKTRHHADRHDRGLLDAFDRLLSDVDRGDRGGGAPVERAFAAEALDVAGARKISGAAQARH